MKEFEFIRTLLSPLSKSEGAASLKDDVALLDSDSIITTDTLVEGVHFFPSDPMDTVARKLIRVNVSDCLAKGARPAKALLNLTWSSTRSDDDLVRFVDGLSRDLATFDIDLIGGDTTTSPDRLVFSLTLIGQVVGDDVVRRYGARSQDDIWITGEIGHGLAGLRALERDVAEDFAPSVQHFRVPCLPDVAVADLIARFANGSADVSDGLAADIRNIAQASGCGFTLMLNDVPFVPDAQKLDLSPSDLICGGDDYQCVFTAPVGFRADIAEFASRERLKVSRVGKMTAARDFLVLDSDGKPVEMVNFGWEHRNIS